MRQIAFILTLFGIFNLTHSQECTHRITGMIVDQHDQEALPYAIVKYGDHRTLSDIYGKYTLDSICTGSDSLFVYYTGNLHQATFVQISSDTTINLYPELHVEKLKTVDISIDRHEQAIIHQDISEADLKKNQGNTLAKTLGSITGVSELKTGNSTSKPVVHGMHSNRLLLMNNGIRHEGQQWGNEHAPEIDPALANNITVIKGASSVKYGSDAIAGVVLIEPAPLKSKKGIDALFNTSYKSNGKSITSSGIINGHHKIIIPIGWRLQGSLKSSGNTSTPSYYQGNTGANEQNFSAALNSHGKNTGFDFFYSQFNTNIGILSGSHIGNLTDLENIIENELVDDSASFTRTINAPYQSIEHELSKTKAYWFLNDSNKLSLTYARQFNRRQEYDNHGGSDEPELEFEITSHTVDLEYSYFTSHDHKTSIGLSGIKQFNSVNGRSFIPNFINSGLGAYVFQNKKLKKWHLEYGVRYDLRRMDVYRSSGEFQHNFGSTSLNLGGTYDLSDYTHLSVNAGRAWRPPSVNELYAYGLHHGAASIERGNTSLDEEKAWNFSSELHYQKKHLDLELDLFYYYFKNYIYAAPTLDYVLTIRGAFPEYEYVQNKAQLYGGDLFLKYALSNQLSISNKTSIVFGDNLDSNTAIIMIPAPKTRLELKYSFKETKLLRKTSASLSYLYQTKQWLVTNDQDLAPTPDAYALFNLEVSTELKNIFLAIEIENLFNTSYRDYLNRWRYYTDDLGRSINLRISIPLNPKS